VRFVCASIVVTGLPFLRHRAGDYRYFNLITGIDDNFAGNFVKIQADFLF